MKCSSASYWHWVHGILLGHVTPLFSAWWIWSTSFVGEFRIVQFSFPKRMSCFWDVAKAVVLPMMGICCNQGPSPVRVAKCRRSDRISNHNSMLNNTSNVCPSKVWSDRSIPAPDANGWWVAGSAGTVIILCFWYHLAVPFETHMPICLPNPPEMPNFR